MVTGKHVYFDNFYHSPELLEGLFYRQTYTCGTIRSNGKNLPEALIKARLELEESVFRYNGPVLALKVV